MHLPQPSFHLSLLLSYTSIQLWGILWQGLDHLTEKKRLKYTLRHMDMW